MVMLKSEMFVWLGGMIFVESEYTDTRKATYESPYSHLYVIFWLLNLLILSCCNSLLHSCSSTLRRWRDGKTVESWQAHSSAVQAVARLLSGELVTGIGFVNSSLCKEAL